MPVGIFIGIIGFIVFSIYYTDGCGKNNMYGSGCNKYVKLVGNVTENICSKQDQFHGRYCVIGYNSEYGSFRAKSYVEEDTTACNLNNNLRSYPCEKRFKTHYPIGKIETFYYISEADFFMTSDYYNKNVHYWGLVGFIGLIVSGFTCILGICCIPGK